MPPRCVPMRARVHRPTTRGTPRPPTSEPDRPQGLHGPTPPSGSKVCWIQTAVHVRVPAAGCSAWSSYAMPSSQAMARHLGCGCQQTDPQRAKGKHLEMATGTVLLLNPVRRQRWPRSQGRSTTMAAATLRPDAMHDDHSLVPRGDGCPARGQGGLRVLMLTCEHPEMARSGRPARWTRTATWSMVEPRAQTAAEAATAVGSRRVSDGPMRLAPVEVHCEQPSQGRIATTAPLMLW